MTILLYVLGGLGIWTLGGLFTARAWWIRALRETERRVARGDTYMPNSYGDRRPITMRAIWRDPRAEWRAAWAGIFWPFYHIGRVCKWVGQLSGQAIVMPAIRAFFADPRSRKPLLSDKPVDKKAA